MLRPLSARLAALRQDRLNKTVKWVGPRARALLPILSIFGLLAFFSLSEGDSFVSRTNFTVITSQAGPLLLISLGATFVILMGSIDLSVGAVATLAASVAVLLIRDYSIGLWAIPITILIGALCGAFNGIIVTYFRLPSFIVTLGTLSIFQGITLHVLNARSIPINDDRFRSIAIGQPIPALSNVALIPLLIWATMVVVGYRTRFGRYTAAIGAGEAVAATSGVPVRRYKTATFIVSGAFAGLAGAFILARLSAASPTIGSGFLLDSVAAIVIGGTALSGGVGGVPRTLIGVLIIGVLSNGLNIMGVSIFTQEIVKGAVVIVAVLTTIDRERMMGIIK